MKQLLALTMLVSLAMICSCQKQDSGAEPQFAQRKAELDARETAVAEREKAVAEKEKNIARSRVIPSDAQSRRQVPDAAQSEAERQRRIEQLPPEVRSLIPQLLPINPAAAEKDRMTREQIAQRQRAPQDLQSQKPYNFEQARKALMSGAAISPAASPTPSPAVEATSPSPSPTPQ
jgi:hypothetical protein